MAKVREAARIDRILRKLRIIWHINQNWRLAQLICNLRLHVKPDPGILFYLEDSDLEEAIDDLILAMDSGITDRTGKVWYRDRMWMVTKDKLYED